MDEELALARIELARLEAQADNLLQQFLDTKEAATVQRTKIDEMLRKRSAPINQLPAELLLEIFTLAIPSSGEVSQYLHSSNGYRKLDLASVSRGWRDIICGCPSFWTTIEVGPGAPSLAIYLKRSKDAPLDVIIRCQPPYGPTAQTATDEFLAILASLIASVHRWRSMVIVGDALDLLQLHHPIVSKFSRLTFPSLKSVIIRPMHPFGPFSANTLLTCPDFLAPKRTPVLEHMELKLYPSSAHLRTANTLKTLELTILTGFTGFDSTLRQISTESLTTLSLMGIITSFALARNSVPFPVLLTLVLHCTQGKQILEAIVVPNLVQLVYIRNVIQGHDPVFGDLESKFDHVQQLFYAWNTSNLGPPTNFDLDYDDTTALLDAFPFVHHAELDLRDIQSVFDSPGSWRLLQSVTLHIISGDWILGTNRLVSWLKARQGLGLPRLCLKLSMAHSDVATFAKLYEALRVHCDLYLEDFLLRPDVFLSMEGNSPLRVVSLKSCDVQ